MPVVTASHTAAPSERAQPSLRDQANHKLEAQFRTRNWQTCIGPLPPVFPHAQGAAWKRGSVDKGLPRESKDPAGEVTVATVNRKNRGDRGIARSRYCAVFLLRVKVSGPQCMTMAEGSLVGGRRQEHRNRIVSNHHSGIRGHERELTHSMARREAIVC